MNWANPPLFPNCPNSRHPYSSLAILPLPPLAFRLSLSILSHNKRQPGIFIIAAGEEATYDEAICDRGLTQAHTEVTIAYQGTASLAIPTCLSNGGWPFMLSLTVINMNYPVDDTLALLPSSLKTLIFNQPKSAADQSTLLLDWMDSLSNLERFELRTADWVTGSIGLPTGTTVTTSLTTLVVTDTRLATLVNFWDRLPNLVHLDLSNNKLVNGLSQVGPSASYSSLKILDLSDNLLQGTIPNDFWSFFPNLEDVSLARNGLSSYTALPSTSKLIKLNLAENLMTAFNPPFDSAAVEYFNLQDINFSSQRGTLQPFTAMLSFELIPNSVRIDISGNPMLTGSLPDLLLGRTTTLRFFNANGCGFTGTLPFALNVASFDLRLKGNPIGGTFPSSYHTYDWSYLDLSDTDVDFCSNLPPALTACNVTSPQVCSCADSWAACTTGCLAPNGAVPLTATPEATTAPIETSPPPVEGTTPPTTSPQTIPTPVTPTCPPPPPGFSCIGGKLVANASIDTPSLTIPGGSTVEINGNLSTTILVFKGLGSTISLSGCANISEGITITFTESDVEKLGESGNKTSIQTLLYQDPSLNCTSLKTVSLSTRQEKSGCKKVKSVKSANDSTFGAVFTLDSSSCNVWWIVLVSVLGGVILIGLVFGLLVAFVPRVRDCVRPYSKRKKVHGGSI